MTKPTLHISVLSEEVVGLLKPKSGGTYLDGTFGGGGHSQKLLEASSPDGVVVGLDKDPEVVASTHALQSQFGRRFVFHNISYDQMDSLDLMFDGIVLDLGLSTDQLKSSGRGFTFEGNEPLDMRFDTTQNVTAAQVLNRSRENELQYMFQEYAQDRYSKRLARSIVERRVKMPFRTADDLIAVVGTNAPKVLAPIFQALRIVVNDELATLTKGLRAATDCLKPNGVLAVISFHSGEDRIVKQFLRDNSFQILTKKPIVATESELQQNPASRSAKLRAGEWNNVEG